MMYFGHVMDGEKRIDEGLAVYMKAPHSYTGEDVVEIQIHGSAEALGKHCPLLCAAAQFLPCAANLPNGLF